MVITKAILEVTMELAQTAEKAYHVYANKYLPDIISLSDDIHSDSFEYQKYHEYERALNKYLLDLDYEIIKDLQAIMYLGRDKDFADMLSGEKRFEAIRRSLTWDKNKSVEVYQMTEKLPLYEYLAKGTEIIKPYSFR